MIFDVGDRVYYISGNYRLGRSNPLKGSEYECQGTVFSADHFVARVRWDNNTENGYLRNDLEFVEKQLPTTNPNILFRRRK